MFIVVSTVTITCIFTVSLQISSYADHRVDQTLTGFCTLESKCIVLAPFPVYDIFVNHEHDANVWGHVPQVDRDPLV